MIECAVTVFIVVSVLSRVCHSVLASNLNDLLADDYEFLAQTKASNIGYVTCYITSENIYQVFELR